MGDRFTIATVPRYLAAFYMAAFVTACSAAIAWTGFHVALNDFWGSLALAEQVEWSSPATLYNLFFPLGYTVLLRLAGSHAVAAAHVVNLAAAVLLLAVMWRFGDRLVGHGWALVAVILLSIHPEIFRYVTTPNADLPMAALAAAGFSRLFWAADHGDSVRRALSAGALLGAAALMRHHALAFAAAAFLAIAVCRVGPRRKVLLAIVGLLAVLAVQMSVSMLAGHGPIQSGQAFNVHKLIHGVNWFKVTDQPAPPSVWAVIAAEPRAFATAYALELFDLAMFPVAPFLLVLVSREPRYRRFGVVSLLTIVIYLLIVSAGGSSRGPLSVRFLVALAFIALIRETIVRTREARSRASFLISTATSALMIAFLALSWVRADYGILKYRVRDHETYRRVEALLRQDGVLSARNVFASDLTLYFPTLQHARPRTNGTWLRIDGSGYAKRFPELCVATLDCFRQDARHSGITHVVLTPDARLLSAALAAAHDAVPSDALELRGRVSPFSVFHVR